MPEIDLGVLTIPKLFQDLQPFLTSEDVPLPQIAQGIPPPKIDCVMLTRLALSLFAEVLDRLQISLNRVDGKRLIRIFECFLTIAVHGFTSYFCQRLENKDEVNSFRAGVKECAQILSRLAQMENQRFVPHDAKLVAQAVFALSKGSTLRDQKAATRLALLKLMRTLMDLYKPSLVADMGSKEFVEGVVSLAEFEKDPTCLNVLFPIYEELSKEWDLSEDALILIWDSFIRYYPIKLGGRAASVPTPDELKQLLLNCFISNSRYAGHAFPRLIDLLDTNQDLSANVKVGLLSPYFYILTEVERRFCYNVCMHGCVLHLRSS